MVGRALTKHPNVIGESGNILAKLGGAEGVNKAAAEALEKIVSEGTRSTKMTKAFGEVVDYCSGSESGREVVPDSGRGVAVGVRMDGQFPVSRWVLERPGNGYGK